MPYAEQLWACEDLIQTQLTDGYKFAVKTDVPCHLWLRWTTTPPRRHSKPIYKRGIYIRADIRFCFVTFTDNEQEEEGDTLIHTFEKHDWPICQTRYFYFHGTIEGIASPSVTPIFDKHFERKGLILLSYEPWSSYLPPQPIYEQIFLEEWSPPPGPEFGLIFTEPWTHLTPPPPGMELIYEEYWSS